jgi:hypothetical protein
MAANLEEQIIKIIDKKEMPSHLRQLALLSSLFKMIIKSEEAF